MIESGQERKSALWATWHSTTLFGYLWSWSLDQNKELCFPAGRVTNHMKDSVESHRSLETSALLNRGSDIKTNFETKERRNCNRIMDPSMILRCTWSTAWRNNSSNCQTDSWWFSSGHWICKHYETKVNWSQTICKEPSTVCFFVFLLVKSEGRNLQKVKAETM